VDRAPADSPTDEYLVWSYVNARFQGRLALDGSAQGAERWPLEPGDYEALLLLYDAYDVAARVPFTVEPGPLPEPAPDEPATPAWDAACAAPDETTASSAGFVFGG